MFDNKEHGKSVTRYFPIMSVTPHLEVLDTHGHGGHGRVTFEHLKLAQEITFRLACQLWREADVVEVIKVNFHQNVNLPEKVIVMQVSLVVAPLHSEKKLWVDEHICLVKSEREQAVDIDMHIKRLKQKLAYACQEKIDQFMGSINKLQDLIVS